MRTDIYSLLIVYSACIYEKKWIIFELVFSMMLSNIVIIDNCVKVLTQYGSPRGLVSECPVLHTKQRSKSLSVFITQQVYEHGVDVKPKDMGHIWSDLSLAYEKKVKFDFSAET